MKRLKQILSCQSEELQVVSAGRGDIEGALEQYTKTRLRDAHALHALDLQARARMGLSGCFHPRYLGTVLHILFWMMVSCVTFGRAEQPYLDALMGRASYAKVPPPSPPPPPLPPASSGAYSPQPSLPY